MKLTKLSTLLLLLLCLAKLYAAEEIALPKLEASTDSGGFSVPSPTVSWNELSAFLPQIPKVNVVTGEYCEEECDLVVAGLEPLSYRRFYEHRGFKDKTTGHWRVNPEAFFLFNFNKFKERNQKSKIYANVGEEHGGVLLLEKVQNKRCTLDPGKVKHFTNATLSGQHHPLNTHVSFKKTKRKERSITYHGHIGTIENGDGRKRYFSTSQSGTLSQDPFAPHQGTLTEEHKSNGNILCYEYIDANGGLRGTSPYYLLASITAYNAHKTQVLGWITFQYYKAQNGEIEKVQVTGSDGRKALLHHQIREVKRQKTVGWINQDIIPRVLDTVLSQVDAPHKPTQYYNYHWEKAKYYCDHPFMHQASHPQGRLLETTYALGPKKVLRQSAPLGPNGEMLPLARFAYYKDHTIVHDGENHKTLYRFNKDQRITAIEKYQGETLLTVERNQWNPKNGNLLQKQIEDGSHHPLCITTYQYDQNHNVIQETRADGQETDTIHRTFSTDGFNLKLTESDRPGKLTHYTYLPQTNLLTSELITVDNHIVKRHFHIYDSELNSFCIKTIIDDGTTEDPYNLTGVTTRHITEYTPKKAPPCLGLPQEILQKTIDAQGHEILLKKVYYHYHPSGKITQEDHYDANGTHRYTLTNTYDQKERLIAQTDPLGNRTTYTYDQNHNLLTQDTPTTHKEWTYDLVNRPLQEKETQTGGTLLLTEKTYDANSRVITQKDPAATKPTPTITPSATPSPPSTPTAPPPTKNTTP